MADNVSADNWGNDNRLGFMFRCDPNTFIPGSPAYNSFDLVQDGVGNYYFGWHVIQANEWKKISGTLTVTEEDLVRNHAEFPLCFDTLNAPAGQNIYIDDFTITKTGEDNLVILGAGDIRSDFETAVSYSIPGGWFAFGGGDLSITWGTTARSGSSALQMSNRGGAWVSPAINLYPVFKEGGAGIYEITFWLNADRLGADNRAGLLIRGGGSEDVNSFIKPEIGGQNYFYNMGWTPITANSWTKITGVVEVLESDLVRPSGVFNLCFDTLDAVTGQNIYIDDFTVYKYDDSSILNTVFDAVFTAPDGTKMTMPGFWDGGDIFKVRFAPTMTGLWTYETVCSDAADAGLHGKTGIFECVPYAGDLDIYKRGFVQAVPGNRHFTYADGTPFFYLGDTHWSMPSEPFETMFTSIVDNRAAKGFTVYQSEPLGAQYNLSGGFYESDISGFRDLDRRFEYIADAGLVHTNAQLFFTSVLGYDRDNFSDKYIEQLARYWVARYAAFPVMWTTAQEADNDFYYGRDNPWFDAERNPWKIVFNAVHKYDPYNHPLTAHQEYATTASDGTLVDNSAFKDLPGHDWFASQWGPAINGQYDFRIPQAYWNYGRISVNYEGKYDHLWTKEFGARVQGWTAYLNGMFGASYGAIDIWLYQSTYDIENNSSDGVDTITGTRSAGANADKLIKWDASMNFPASYQMGYMRSFFEEIEWWRLVPQFNIGRFSNNNSYYSVAATNDSEIFVGYFYNTDRNTTLNRHLTTGTFTNMIPGAAYEKIWFNPRTGEYGAPEIVTIAANGQHAIGNKPDANDWVILMKLLP
ncbi:MAG: DUF4038 domain-containing protein [Firmicutes bacterium]|nr:DUF4038 domain-containing protein [Bacillota bacterium]